KSGIVENASAGAQHRLAVTGQIESSTQPRRKVIAVRTHEMISVIAGCIYGSHEASIGEALIVVGTTAWIEVHVARLLVTGAGLNAEVLPPKTQRVSQPARDLPCVLHKQGRVRVVQVPAPVGTCQSISSRNTRIQSIRRDAGPRDYGGEETTDKTLHV